VAAYWRGLGGGKKKGLQWIEGAADSRGENQPDAQGALVLLYTRERRYDDALKVLAKLRAAYPRNRLFWLEAGATSLRAGRASEAEQFFNEGITRFSSDERPRMFGEEGLWFYKRGAARPPVGRAADAEGDLKKSLATEARDWVHGRAHLELAKLALKAGNRPAANADLRIAITLCDGDNDGLTADEARQLLK